jgi:hypothetical protein
MHEDEPRDPRVLETGRHVRSLIVCQVPERPGDTTLEVGWIRSHFEQAWAVVRLEQDEIAPAEEGSELSPRMPEVGGDRKRPAARRNPQRDVWRIMRNGKRLDDEWAQ